MEKMSALDATFLEVEDAVSHMHIGLIGVFEPPAPEPGLLRAMILGKLPDIRRYRQIAQPIPLSAGRPVWVDDRHFNLDYHLRRTGLPAPGGDAELRRLVGRVMSQPLDRSKPLWEMWVVEGLDGGRWALISKIHHCMVDGVAGSDLMDLLLDHEQTAEPAPAEPWRPRRAPSEAELLARGLLETATLPLQAVRAVPGPRELLRRGGQAAVGLARLGGAAVPTPRSSLNGPLGPHRRWAWAHAGMADVKEVREAFGGTVNDVVLACITGGFRRLLDSRGEPVEGPVRTLVPVSVRVPSQHGEYNNRVSAIFAELPVSIGGPVERLEAVRAQMAELKASHEAEAAEVLTALGGFTAQTLLALAERVATKVPQRSVNTVTTNVPGPRHPLYACGRRMLAAYPYVPLGGHVTIGVAIYSYDGACTFGVTGDYDAAPDVEVLCREIEASLAELLAHARHRTGAAARRVPAGAGRGSRAAT